MLTYRQARTQAQVLALAACKHYNLSQNSCAIIREQGRL